MTRPRLPALLLVASALAACGGDFESIDRPDNGEEGQLRLVNMTTDNPYIDLYESNNKLQEEVAGYSASGYSSLSNSSHSLSVRETNKTATLVTTSVTTARDTHQALVAYTTGANVAVTALTEDEATPAVGTARLRIFNAAATDSGNVDVFVVTTACSAIATSTATPVAGNVGITPTAYLVVTPSTTAFHVCVTAANDKTKLKLDLPSLLLRDQRNTTLIFSRTPTDRLKAVTFDQQGAVTLVPSPSP